jgi:hypothetical protein
MSSLPRVSDPFTPRLTQVRFSVTPESRSVAETKISVIVGGSRAMDVFTMGSNHSGDVRMSYDSSVSNKAPGDAEVAASSLTSAVAVPIRSVPLSRPGADQGPGPVHWPLRQASTEMESPL